MLLVVQPFTIVGGAFGVDEGTAAVSHAVHPLALVDTSIGLNHTPKALHLVVHELALVLRAIWPDQDAQTVLDFATTGVLPLSLVLLGHFLGVHGV
mmetsp:Transcript_10862/g.13700  ORF Transcript_10862/g.13700 Transcript_10862/m.13700 type:complete len:96 (+) Transcript_10862:986-1273(+)|eukprot:CAMPEP_0170466882 /NCGR_PEP_ID=MMETSP0123-20130129/10673_1 /TAXON_ID=182087 /ORGANISM="Favella ehrenbergii, Strain Fehren 1" /LENGTH=95 /DNA_ID=CAMNT_0010733117 /DNA_START=984 /DNA_END=1271 /DNA_ORIENTATION=+